MRKNDIQLDLSKLSIKKRNKILGQLLYKGKIESLNYGDSIPYLMMDNGVWVCATRNEAKIEVDYCTFIKKVNNQFIKLAADVLYLLFTIILLLVGVSCIRSGAYFVNSIGIVLLVLPASLHYLRMFNLFSK